MDRLCEGGVREVLVQPVMPIGRTFCDLSTPTLPREETVYRGPRVTQFYDSIEDFKVRKCQALVSTMTTASKRQLERELS